MPYSRCAVPVNFGLAFEQMCSVVAISRTRSSADTLRQLLLQCMVILPDDRFKSAQQLADAVDALFGLQIPEHEVDAALGALLRDGSLDRRSDGSLLIPLSLEAQLASSIEASRALEDKVKEEWLTEVENLYPRFPLSKAWPTVRAYLASAFRRHGMQAAALLDPHLEISVANSDSLSHLLDSALRDTGVEDLVEGRAVISSFLTTASVSASRVAYIGQLADGAFNYFSLAAAPEVASELARSLSSLVLFLDTNFLFGILDLHTNSQVAVSHDLLRAVAMYGLPFSLVYHHRTKSELMSTVSYYAGNLCGRIWPQGLSRAALRSQVSLSGIELRYHQLNAEQLTAPEDFIAPYRHADVLLDQRGIHLVRPDEDNSGERQRLQHAYEAFLSRVGKEKGYEAIDHDITVLAEVRRQRSSAPTSLEAKALLLTCDYWLNRFDWELSRSEGRPPCTVLPNLLWQVIRPLIPRDSDFDRSFADTFALPEFRSVQSRASEASSRMMSILAAYRGLPEETAVRLLSNDLLLDTLRVTSDGRQFQQQIDSAIAHENETLCEERALLQRELECSQKNEMRSKKSSEEKIKELKRYLEKQTADAESARSGYLLELQEDRQVLTALQNEVAHEREARVAREQEAQEALKRAEAAEAGQAIMLSLSASVVGCGALLGITHLLPWPWLRNHPDSYGLQAGMCAMIVCASFALFWRAHRAKWTVLTLLLIPSLLLVFELLGGPATPHP